MLNSNNLCALCGEKNNAPQRIKSVFINAFAILASISAILIISAVNSSMTGIYFSRDPSLSDISVQDWRFKSSFRD